MRGAGEGKPKITDEKQTTVYKRALDVEYRLKMAASRQVTSAILCPLGNGEGGGGQWSTLNSYGQSEMAIGIEA